MTFFTFILIFFYIVTWPVVSKKMFNWKLKLWLKTIKAFIAILDNRLIFLFFMLIFFNSYLAQIKPKVYFFVCRLCIGILWAVILVSIISFVSTWLRSKLCWGFRGPIYSNCKKTFRTDKLTFWYMVQSNFSIKFVLIKSWPYIVWKSTCESKTFAGIEPRHFDSNCRCLSSELAGPDNRLV